MVTLFGSDCDDGLNIVIGSITQVANWGACWSHFFTVTDDHGVSAALGVQNTSGKSEGELVTLFWQ